MRQRTREAPCVRAGPSPLNQGRLPIWGVVAALILAVCVGGLLAVLDLQPQVLALMDRVADLGPWGPVIFILIDMLVVVLVLPGVLVTFSAGFLFGVVNGSLYVVIATASGAVVAFLIARYSFGERAAGFLLAHPKFRLLHDEFGRGAWKFVLLTRLVPFFPYKLSNYFFGLTRFSLRDFFVGTVFGIVPITVFNVYVGSLAGELATVGSSETPHSPIYWLLVAIGLIATVMLVMYSAHHARLALKRYVPQDPRETEP